MKQLDEGPVKLIDLPQFSEGGSLIFGEYPTHLPFQPRRFFVISDVSTGDVRGKHAHITCKQFLICLVGQIDVIAECESGARQYSLLPGSAGLFLDSMVWAQQKYVLPGSILLVLASENYQADDYLSDYGAYHDRISQLVRDSRA